MSPSPAAKVVPADDLWRALDIPAYLRRVRLGLPPISSGPDDDLRRA
jgi:hypothetical protein